MKIALFGIQYYEALEEIIAPFINLLQNQNHTIYLYDDFRKILERFYTQDLTETHSFANYDDLQNDIDLFFTFGGDGTILNAVTIIRDKKIPIVGVNLGRLGYLATINKNVFLENVPQILAGNYIKSVRSLLEIKSNQKNFELPFALNEISTTRRETTSMISIDVWLNGQFLNSFWADGLIISTPTGSTGYNLSCGGPVIHPDCSNFVITAIAPHNLNNRPFIINDSCTLKLKINSRVKEYFLSMDTRNVALSTDVELFIKKANFKINVIELPELGYVNSLKEKLSWGFDKRN